LLALLPYLFAFYSIAHYLLSGEPTPEQVPDIVNAAAVAGSFDGLMYLSENGYYQNIELQKTGGAVWTLAESIRQANMVSAPQIVEHLETLSVDLRSLGHNLAEFLKYVDADLDR
jgi:hypothetical protein